MERATQRDERGYYLAGDGIYSDCGAPEKFRGEDIDRLAAYEDTGIEPRAIEHLKLASMGKAIAEITEFEGIPIDRLRELAELDSAGCIPPCKIGDVFYRLWYGFDSAEVKEYRVSMITQKADKSWRIRATDTEDSFQID